MCHHPCQFGNRTSFGGGFGLISAVEIGTFKKGKCCLIHSVLHAGSKLGLRSTAGKLRARSHTAHRSREL
jgi:hypothetical protein